MVKFASVYTRSPVYIAIISFGDGLTSGETLGLAAPLPLLVNLPLPQRRTLNSCLVNEFWQKCQNLGEDVTRITFVSQNGDFCKNFSQVYKNSQI